MTEEFDVKDERKLKAKDSSKLMKTGEHRVNIIDTEYEDIKDVVYFLDYSDEEINEMLNDMSIKKDLKACLNDRHVSDFDLDVSSVSGGSRSSGFSFFVTDTENREGLHDVWESVMQFEDKKMVCFKIHEPMEWGHVPDIEVDGEKLNRICLDLDDYDDYNEFAEDFNSMKDDLKDVAIKQSERDSSDGERNKSFISYLDNVFLDKYPDVKFLLGSKTDTWGYVVDSEEDEDIQECLDEVKPRAMDLKKKREEFRERRKKEKEMRRKKEEELKKKDPIEAFLEKYS